MPIQWRIAELLKQRKWSGYRLAKESGLTPSTIYKLLKKGELTEIDVTTLEKLAAAFGISPFKLLEQTPESR